MAGQTQAQTPTRWWLFAVHTAVSKARLALCRAPLKRCRQGSRPLSHTRDSHTQSACVLEVPELVSTRLNSSDEGEGRPVDRELAWLLHGWPACCGLITCCCAALIALKRGLTCLEPEFPSSLLTQLLCCRMAQSQPFCRTGLPTLRTNDVTERGTSTRPLPTKDGTGRDRTPTSLRRHCNNLGHVYTVRPPHITTLYVPLLHISPVPPCHQPVFQPGANLSLATTSMIPGCHHPGTRT